jgi:hypothetical protein
MIAGSMTSRTALSCCTRKQRAGLRAREFSALRSIAIRRVPRRARTVSRF